MPPQNNRPNHLNVLCYQGPKHNTRIITRLLSFDVPKYCEFGVSKYCKARASSIPSINNSPAFSLNSKVTYKVTSFWYKPESPAGPNELDKNLPPLAIHTASVENLDPEESLAFLFYHTFKGVKRRLEVACTTYLREPDRTRQESLNKYREVVEKLPKHRVIGLPIEHVLGLLQEGLDEQELENLLIGIVPHLSSPSIEILADRRAGVQSNRYGSYEVYLTTLISALRTCLYLELSVSGQKIRRIENLPELTLATEI